MTAKPITKPTKKRKTQRQPGFRVGDMVEIRHTDGVRAQIIELRGPLGPNGANIYRVRYRRKPRWVEVEVREDQLKLIPAEV
jgi:hypothetical protein